MRRSALPVLAYRKNGRPIHPIRGGSEPPNQPAPANQLSDRPEGVSEDDWKALGDPGNAALVRERARATAAEQALAAERAKNIPKPAPKPPDPAPKPDEKPDPNDVGELIRRHVEAALTPFRDAEAARQATQAAERIRDAVQSAAKARFHDPGDAITQIDLSSLTDGQGRADEAKVKAALDDLLTRKPYLGKAVDTRRRGTPGSPVGATPNGNAKSLEDRVKEQLALMNRGR